VARGAKKFRSKLAAHLEPICLCEVMAVSGKQYDYIGSIISTNCFVQIKNNLDRVQAAVQGMNVFNKLIKYEQKDHLIFDLLLDFLNILNKVDLKIDPQFLTAIFKLKLIDLLGFKPELFNCMICGKKLKPGGSRFDLRKNGFICHECQSIKGIEFQNFRNQLQVSGKSNFLTASDDCIKVLRLVIENDFSILEKLNIKISLKQEILYFIDNFFNYSQ